MEKADHRLVQLGILLSLLGLLTGLVIPQLANLRMGLASHMAHKLRLSHFWLTMAFWLGIYGTFAN